MNISGFSYAAARAGIRGKDRLDVALIYSDIPSVAAGVFTTNLVKAAPVQLDLERLAAGRAQAIVVNSGIANACTGRAGYEAALQTAAIAASTLNIAENMVLVASTGVIGDQLPVKKIGGVMPALAAALTPTGYDDVSRAIMTTDTVPKIAGRSVAIDDGEVKIFALAKGSGMIMPNMATMLCFVMTDINIAQPVLHEALTRSVDKSFNRITVDGDTSTNDMVLVLANGRADNRRIDDTASEPFLKFQAGLTDLLRELAMKIVIDGEGATKCVTIRVVGGVNDREADQAARTVANSSLVKTAFFGEDANWGRIIAALGRAGIMFEPERVDIGFDDAVLVRGGLGLGREAEESATRVLKQRQFAVNIDLKAGSGTSEIYTCDLSLDYVKINADYRS
jgi:glutamate N-acetyltransferase/amino-acid N-acetyltransferase